MIKIQKSDCCGCYSCITRCPNNCIKMLIDSEGFCYPRVNLDICSGCDLCDQVCPTLMINKKPIWNNQKAYAAINKNDKIRFDSSSGGVFTLFAESIIDQNGIVFGAAFDENFNVNHIEVKSKENLSQLRGSKYVQSKIGNTYRQAEKYLKQHIPVLFTGTPCQIAGLKRFLLRDYPNLYCQDIICHGVPSPLIWADYVKTKTIEIKEAIVKISFREKRTSWKNFSLSIMGETSPEYYSNYQNDPYMKGFLNNLYLRPSCYKCYFKTLNRESDLTLADFWGIDEIFPDMNDDKGVSLVIINSNKGEKIWKSVQDSLIKREVSIDQAIKYNSAAITSVPLTQKRSIFFDNYGNQDFNLLIDQLTKETQFQRFKYLVKLIRNKFTTKKKLNG